MNDKAVTVEKKNEYSNCGGCNKKKCLWKDWEWFSPQAQMYCRSEILWYGHNKKEYFDLNLWPDCPWAPHNELPTAKNPVSGLHVVKVPVGVVKDFSMMMEMRLNRCGEDGKTLIEEIQSWSENRSASILYSNLSSVAKLALNYCSSYKMRKTPYPVWKAKQKEKAKKV